MAFFGFESVVRARDRCRDYGGKLVSGTLTPSDGSASVSFSNVYVYPFEESSALGAGGAPTVSTTIVIYRMGETSRPRADDSLTAGGFSWLVTSVSSRLNADESSNYAVYECRVIRVAKSGG